MPRDCTTVIALAWRSRRILLEPSTFYSPVAASWGRIVGLSPVLAQWGGLWQEPAARDGFVKADSVFVHACCRSSVVEHSLGKGEVDSSILSGSTMRCEPAPLTTSLHPAAKCARFGCVPSLPENDHTIASAPLPSCQKLRRG